MSDTPVLSVIVPCYNERATVAELLRRVRAVPIEKEIIVIDDQSTRRLARHRRGLAHGMARAPPHRPARSTRAKARRCARGIRGGARRHRHHSGRRPRVRPRRVSEAHPADPRRRRRRRLRLALRRRPAPRAALLAHARQQVPHVPLERDDEPEPHRHGDLLQGLPPRGHPVDQPRQSNRFGFEPEITAKVARRGYRIYEVPISYHGRDYWEGKKINWKDGFSAIWTILKYGLFVDVTSEPAGYMTLRRLDAAQSLQPVDLGPPPLARRTARARSRRGNGNDDPLPLRPRPRRRDGPGNRIFRPPG